MIKFLEVKRAYYADPENVVVEFMDVDGYYRPCVGEPSWRMDCDYRIRPRTIRIGDIDVPEPVREPLMNGQKYFAVSTNDDNFCYISSWDDHKIDEKRLARGLIHLTKEAAIEHAKALIIVSGGKV